MQDLASLLERAPLPLGEAVPLAAGIAAEVARQQKHARRPLRISPDQLVVFKLADGRTSVQVKTGAAPATSTSASDDEAAAAYELGTLIYRALTGKTPFKGEIALQRDLEEVLEAAGAGAPTGLEDLVVGLLAAEGGERPKLVDAAERLQRMAIEVLKNPAVAKASAPLPRVPIAAKGETSGPTAVTAEKSGGTPRTGRPTSPVPPALPPPPVAGGVTPAAAPSSAAPAAARAEKSQRVLPPLPSMRQPTPAQPVPSNATPAGGLPVPSRAPSIFPAPGTPRPSTGLRVPTATEPRAQQAPVAAAEPDEDAPTTIDASDDLPIELTPSAPILPATPAVAAPAAPSSTKKKNATDTQDRLFFAEGEKQAAELRAEVAAADPDDEYVAGDKVTLTSLVAVAREKRGILIGAGAALVVLIIVLVIWARKDDKKAAAVDPFEGRGDATKVAGTDPAPSAAPTPPPVAPEPPAAATPEPDAAPEPAAEPPAEADPPPTADRPRPVRPKVTAQPKPEPPKPATPAPATSSAPKTSAEWLAQAKTHRQQGRAKDAYGAYKQASARGSGAQKGAGELGMAQMAYVMKNYRDTVAHAQTAIKLGVAGKPSWRILAEAYCKLGQGRAAWDAFTRAGGGDCKK